MADALTRLAAAAGILPKYTDLTGLPRPTAPETARALLAAMGLPAETDEQAQGTLDALADAPLPRDVICLAGRRPPLEPQGDWVLSLEDGTVSEGRGRLPAVPLGIHTLQADGQRHTLLAAPRRLPLPPRSWGMIVPLYALSATGIGSYDDLATLAEGLGAQGAGFAGLNPVHAGFPAAPEVFSPYTPSHRRRLNVMHLATGTGADGPLIDYRAEVPARMAALRTRFDAGTDPAFDTWRAAEGPALDRFATHQALSFVHGPFWDAWPKALQDPGNPQVQTAAAGLQRDIAFHAWLQWQAEQALDAAQARARASGMRFGLYLDLAVGTHPHGAETWEDRHSFAPGVSLGSPPDAFSAQGQCWHIAPFNPRALRAGAYAPLSETLRRQLRFSGLLRIDHILGFERAFWVPLSGNVPGGYVAMPRDAMLAVVRIEAARAGACIVGEDLGNLPDGLRGALKDSGVLGCRVAMFERTAWGDKPRFRRPGGYDAAAIASFSTHDLPTWDGWRSGADLAARARLGSLPDPALTRENTLRKAEVAALDRVLDSSDTDGMHAFLARSRSRLVAVQVENLLGIEDQPNLPGTVEEFPNWRQRLPVPSGSLARHDGVTRVAQIMRNANRSGEGP